MSKPCRVVVTHRAAYTSSWPTAAAAKRLVRTSGHSLHLPCLLQGPPPWDGAPTKLVHVQAKGWIVVVFVFSVYCRIVSCPVSCVAKRYKAEPRCLCKAASNDLPGLVSRRSTQVKASTTVA
jgi:hypothetical protein